jgi:hypothetical protein
VANELETTMQDFGESQTALNEAVVVIADKVKSLSDNNTASSLLNKIKTVDGSGSGLDADLLDGLSTGQTGSSYIPYANASGNVGIGKSSPVTKLDVGGTFSSTDYRKAMITNATTSGASVNVGVTSPYMVFVSYYNKSTFASGHSLVTVSSGGVFQIAHNDGSGCGVSFTGNLISFTVKTTSGSVFATIRIIN